MSFNEHVFLLSMQISFWNLPETSVTLHYCCVLHIYARRDKYDDTRLTEEFRERGSSLSRIIKKKKMHYIRRMSVIIFFTRARTHALTCNWQNINPRPVVWFVRCGRFIFIMYIHMGFLFFVCMFVGWLSTVIYVRDGERSDMSFSPKTVTN